MLQEQLVQLERRVRLVLLVPLALQWWTGSSGSRGLTVTLWDRTNARLESVTTGRAAGADPGFAHSWTTPLLWASSAATLAGGPFTLQGAERRDDGTLSATTGIVLAMKLTGVWGWQP